VDVITSIADLLTAGARLDFADPERPEFQAPTELRGRVASLLTRETRPATHRALRLVAGYRRALLRLFATMNAETPTADPDAYQAEVRLHDDLGPRLAALIRAEAAAAYVEQTHRCGRCGGPAHDPGPVTGDSW
jgi:hypothetical protein